MVGYSTVSLNIAAFAAKRHTVQFVVLAGIQKVLEGRSYRLQHPWIGIVNRLQADIMKNTAMVVARRREREYFDSSPDYGHLASKMGYEYLAKLLSKEELKKEIKKENMELLNELKKDLVTEVTKVLEENGKNLKNEVSQMMKNFTSSSSGMKEEHDAPAPNSQPSKKKKTLIYATPKTEVPKHIGKRGSQSEPRFFGFKRRITFADVMDDMIWKANVNEEDDLPLLQYIFDEKLPPSDVLVSIDDCQCTRLNFFTLRPEQWVDDMVINTNIAMMEYEERLKFEPDAPRSWFLPTVFEPQLKMNPDWDARTIYKNFLSPNRHGSVDLGRTHSIFVVLNHRNVHWYVCVIDMIAQKISLFDSLLKVNLEERLLQVKPLLQRLRDALYDGYPNSFLLDIMDFPCEVMKDVAKQNNGDDCGLFAIHFMRVESGLDDMSMKHFPSSKTLREVTSIRMVKHFYNKRKYSVLKAVDKWKMKI